MAEICSYFGKCGGCSYQNIGYPQQLAHKLKLVKDLIKFEDIKIFHGGDYYYRNRMDFVMSPDGIGFRVKRHWSEIVDITNCNISNDKLNILLAEVRDFFKDVNFFDVYRRVGTFRYAVIRTPGRGKVMDGDNFDSSISFVLNKDSACVDTAISRITEFSKITTAKNILVTFVGCNTDQSCSLDYKIIKGSDLLTETLGGKKFSYSAQGFFQNNSEVAEMIHQYVRGLLKGYNGCQDKVLLDLFGGVGTFGIINSDLFSRVKIIEVDSECVRAARVNISENNVLNADILLMDAKNIGFLNLGTNLVAICDPPRAGMSVETIAFLTNSLPSNLIYVSCNPESLARDLGLLSAKYSIRSVAVFDMFPQTPHVETVVELVLK